MVPTVTLRKTYQGDGSQFVDLKKYPLLARGSAAYQEVVAHCQSELKKSGACILPGFLTSSSVEELAKEADLLAPVAFHNPVVGNAYLEPADAALPKDHPKNMSEPTSVGVVAYDQFPQGSGIRMVYEWAALKDFLEDVLGRGPLYHYADTMGALNLSVMKDQEYLRWHFDQTDFVTSLALQSSTAGGEFEYVPNIRGAGRENFDTVKSLLRGDHSSVVKLATEPGTLILFEGRYSIHRVTPITGPRLRHMALFGFDTKQGVTSSSHLRKMRYGRD